MGRTTREKPISGWMLAAEMVLLIVVVLGMMFAINNRIPTGIVPPPPKMPKPNAWDDFARAGNMLGMQGPVSSTRKKESWTIAELRAFEKSNAQALVMLRSGLGKQCRCPAARSASAVFPEYVKCRELARTLLSESYYYQRTGQPGKAMDSMLDADELGAMIPKGAPLIGGLVGVATQAIGISDMEEVIPKLNETELAHAAKRMEIIKKKQVSYSEIILEEGYFCTAAQVELLRRGNILNTIKNLAGWSSSSGASGSSLPMNLRDYVEFAFANKPAMIRDNLAYYKAVAKEQRGPCAAKSRVRAPRNLLFRVLGSDMFARARNSFTRTEAMNVVIETEIALRRYYLANEKYPDQLVQLAPIFVKSIPVDPFGLRKPLKYKSLKNGTSYLLYSLGPDMIDDGGMPLNMKYYPMNKSGDLVAGNL